VNKDQIIITISRADIWNLNVRPVLKSLKKLTKHLFTFHGSVHFIFNGYNDDPREVFEIPEIIKYYLKLDELAPYLPILISKDIVDKYNQFGIYLCCMVPFKKVSQKGDQIGLELNSEAAAAFLSKKLVFIGSFLATQNIPQKESEEIIKSISDALDGTFGESS